MTTWAGYASNSYDGPEWAAPEHAERWSHRPETRRDAADFPLRALVGGVIQGSDYVEMRRIEHATRRANAARGVPARHRQERA